MAKTIQKEKTLEREYIIPLRREVNKVPRYKKTAKSVKAIKEFIAKHMRVPDRDLSKVKIDVYLNNELWFKGSRKPFNKIKVKAKKVGDVVSVELVDVPGKIKFDKIKKERKHKKLDVKASEKTKKKSEEIKTEQDKEDEKEKAKAGEQANIKLAKTQANIQKHSVGKSSGPQVQRKALKK